ncbi:hypothetical protein KAFR_0C01020 [Kazachstania africana CBS 2517]|uniref:MHD domain-containing protein n=1 Tax=Kazachstania africana (strain ATCC 22294 / BCRC 22015 / CBS 2517 / CECT 1963 / NBRC 1671 / NRRL Y-8276) TaxID=1071382 RepID=H2ARU7_KAZAF|nr:hypothetical protein KAFR_0C01020 [Kazachstania africana CBS 2517]CCF57097.1 hypothetical protein KAFR_0C01020 [Kazachstania africana CBS 2517]
MISAILIYTPRGELIVSKLYRNNIKRSISEIFRIQVINNFNVRSPILTLGSTTFHHIRSTANDPTDDELWLVCVNRNNANSAAIWEFLQKLNLILQQYGITSESKLKDEFMTVHEILDNMLLGTGIIQNTDLKSIVDKMSVKPISRTNETTSTQTGFLKRRNTILTTPGANFSLIPTNRHDAHKKNEIFFFVNESMNLLVSKDGSILKNYVDGKIEIKSHLNGNPTCQFELVDDQTKITDFKFDQCIEKVQSRTVRVAATDGELEIVNYHVRDDKINIPFKITPIVSTVKDTVDYRISLKSLFPKNLSATDVVLTIPVPPNTIDCKINVSNGHCKFKAEQNAVIWTFNKFNGSTENTLSAITIADGRQIMNLESWTRPSIQLTFEITMYSISGLLLRNLMITDKDKRRYKASRWIKYISRAGSYEMRF